MTEGPHSLAAPTRLQEKAPRCQRSAPQPAPSRLLAILFCTMIASTLSVAALGAAAGKPETLAPELVKYLSLTDKELGVGEGALRIAREEHPELDLRVQLGILDQWADRLEVELARAGTARQRLDALKNLLFVQEKFGLPKADDAEAFLLSEVLKNRRGNCLGLSVLCLALAERAGLQLHGVPVPSRGSGPGHLLVRYDDGHTRINFDPTEQGASHPDEHYLKLFALKESDLKGGYILANAKPRLILNLLLVNLGGERILAGRPAAALPLLEEARKLKPDYAPLHNNLGAACLELGDWTRAQQAYEEALRLDPRTVGPRLGLGELALRNGKAEPAEQAAKAVLELEPANVQAQSLLASVCLNRRAFGEARRILTELLHAQPKNLVLRCNLGQACLLEGSYAEAEQQYRTALAQDPNCIEAHHGLGLVCQATDRQAEAKQAFDQATRLAPGNPATLLAQALSAERAKRFGEAEAAYRGILKSQPQHLEALGGLAQSLLAQKKFDEAAAVLKEALAAHAGNASLLLLQGEVKMATGDLRGALALLQQVLGGAQGLGRKAILQRIAVCQGRLNDHHKAWETAESILKEDPADLVALEVAAAACEGLRNKTKAVGYYRRVLQLEPGHAKALAALKRLGERP